MTTTIIGAILIAAVALVSIRLNRLSKRVEACEAELAAPRGCQHPEVKNVGTFGAPEFQCQSCGAMVDE